MYLRDEMIREECAHWRYRCEDGPDWWDGLGYTADDIDLALFGA